MRQERMSVAMIDFAPAAANSSMIELTRLRGTIDRTAIHAGSAIGDTVGDSIPGVIVETSSRRPLGQL